ncbi:MAG: hypothetical protein CMJ25_10390 [Phycisphaerae bacterium]|nr:hypothetical protein [Phycisphaerae bacterium]|tara:strand:- start:126 stop:326 length:201 start_codon:yes stop_codon:yes gene_type:complete
MLYYTKSECYTDTLLSLRLGIVSEEDLRYVLEYYKDIEHYECCAGVVDAYVEFKREKKQIIEDEEN